jgi:hypothetical protein
VEAENAVTLASVHGDAEGLVWEIVFLEDELAEERCA